MSCCEDLLTDLISGNKKIASKAIQWDDAVIWAIAGAVAGLLGGPSGVLMGAAGSGAGGFIGQNKDFIAEPFSSGFRTTPEQWALALIYNDPRLYTTTGNPGVWIPDWSERTSALWSEFWANNEGKSWAEQYVGDEGLTSWSRAGRHPESPEFWTNWNVGRQNFTIPEEARIELGEVFLDYVWRGMASDRAILDFVGIKDLMDWNFSDELNDEMFPLQPFHLQKFAVLSALEQRLYSTTQDVSSEIPVYEPYSVVGSQATGPSAISRLLTLYSRNPEMLGILNRSVSPGEGSGYFLDWVMHLGNLEMLNDNSPLFNMIFGELLEADGPMKQYLVDNLLSTEDGEGSYLFDQAVQRSINRSMGFDPETGLNPLTATGDRTLNPEEFAQIHPDETFIAPSLNRIIETANDAKETATDAHQTASSLLGKVNTAMSVAESAMKQAMEAKSIAKSAKYNSAVTSDMETPSYVKGGGPQ